LSAEEKSFFNSLGINPSILFMSLGHDINSDKSINVNGKYYIAGKFIYFPNTESIIGTSDENLDKSDDTRFQIGRYEFYFLLNVESTGASYGFEGIDTILKISFTVTVPWILKEKKRFNHLHLFNSLYNRRYMKELEKQSQENVLKLLQKLRVDYKQYSSLEYKRYHRDWFNHFGLKDKYCIDHCLSTKNRQNYLWHLFSWKIKDCMNGFQAKDAYTKLIKNECIIMFENEKLCFEVYNISTLDLDNIKDIFDLYITDKCFNWTYVQTHENDCGPYFYKL
jgi:hypothetical protein